MLVALALLVCGAFAPRVNGQVNGCGTALYDTGPFDGRSGQWSVWDQYLGDEQTADDFYLPPGNVYRIDRITATLIGRSIIPKARIRLYEDCNGAPGSLITSFDTADFTDTGLTVSGQKAWTVRVATPNLWLPGGKAYWLSVMGLLITPDDQWFWATAGNGVIGGVPGMYRAVLAGNPNWVSVARFGCGCTDFAMRLEGVACTVLWDNGDPDPVAGGAPSISSPTIFDSRAADDFITPTCEDVTVCFVQAVMYGNCNPMSGRFEVYENQCNMPGDPAVFVAPFSRVIDLGYSVMVGGASLRAYRVQAFDPGWVLTHGRNYWLSAVANGAGSLNERAYFANATSCDRCPIQLNGGAARSAVGTPPWARFEQPLGQGHDFSFLIAVKQTTALANGDGSPTCPADFNKDHVVDTLDVFEYLTAWFAGCP